MTTRLLCELINRWWLESIGAGFAMGYWRY